jgi:cell division protease FtsH
MEKRTGFNVGYLIFALLAVMVLRDVWTQARTVETVPYSTFEQYLKDGKVDQVSVGERVITGKLKSPEPDGKTVVVSSVVEPQMAERLSRFNVTYTRAYESTWLRDILSWVAPAAVFFAIWYFVFRKFADKMGTPAGSSASGRARPRSTWRRRPA